MADQVSSKVAELSWAIGKFLVKASGVGLLADLSDVARKLCELLPALIKNEDGDVNNDVAEQINKVLTSKIRNMYGRPTVNKELLEVAATEVKFLLDQIIDDDKLLVFAVKNPDSFSDLLRKLAYARQLEIEQEAEPYFRELVDVVKEQYVKVVPWSSEFDKAALKYLLASNEQALTRLDQVYELLEDTNKEVKNSNAKLDYVKEAVNDIPDKVVARMESKFSTPMREPFTFGVRPDVAAFYIERGERERLHDLAIEGQQPRIVLTGMRGCGKSQLASDLAQRCEKQEWSFVVWINAVSRESVQSDLVELAQRLPIDRSDKPTQDQLINRCLDYFKSANDTGRLIVFDNVEDINHLIGLVPSGDGLRVVATTTNEYGWKNQSWDQIKIGVFSREDSIKCLLRITDSKDREAAGAYKSVGRFDDAVELYEQVLADRMRVLGPDHPNTLEARNNLAGAYDDIGRFSEAIELYERVLADQERVLGPDHPDTLTTRNNLAVAYRSAGRFGEAIELYKWVLADQERVLGPDHPDTLITRNNLAGAYKDVGRFGEAIELYKRVLADQERILAPDHPDTLTARNNLAVAYRYVGRFGEAIELFERVLADRVRVLGPDHPDTLTTRNNLAFVYHSAGRFGEAIELYERVLADQEQVLGPDHPETLDVRDNLAGAYDSVGRLAEAIDAWEKLLPDCQRVLGLGHPLTKLVQKNLEAAKRKMNPPDAPSPETGED